MYIPFVPSTRRSYALLHPQDFQSQNDKILQEERSNQDHSIKLPGLLALTWMTLLTIIVAGSLGLLIGWHLPRKLQADIFLDGLLRMRSHKSSPYLHGHLICGYMIGPAGTITSTLHYNKAFTLKPSNATEAAWRSLFPSMPSTALVCPGVVLKQRRRRSRILPSSSFWSQYLWPSRISRASLLSEFQPLQLPADSLISVSRSN